ncbi:MAG TPA: TetR/AcrR family transcriptional regulator [Bacteroidales bacterium]|nr:TetR/AcrR family transcriptional regulator [Bacteroidales bacterium]
MEVREKIISGAQKMFMRNGIRNITMDAIAVQLGISKRTIYEKFEDKDELLLCCLELAIAEQRSTGESLLNSSENVIEALIKIVKYNIQVLKTINPAFFQDIKKHYPLLSRRTIESNDKQNMAKFIELLKRGIKEQVFRDAINVEIVARLLFEQFKIMNNAEVFPSDKFSKAEVFENLVINFLRGIATEKGWELIEKYNG